MKTKSLFQVCLNWNIWFVEDAPRLVQRSEHYLWGKCTVVRRNIISKAVEHFFSMATLLGMQDSQNKPNCHHEQTNSKNQAGDEVI